MTEPTQLRTDHRIGRIFHLYHTFEEQRRAFAVLMRTGTPNWQLLANKSYMEWLLRNREKIKSLAAQAAERMVTWK